jgi:hypothetical protein
MESRRTNRPHQWAMDGVLGGISGGAGTVVMSGLMLLAQRAGLLGEPPPQKITRRFLRWLGLPRRGRLEVVSSLFSHLAFGVVAGGLYGLLAPRRAHRLVRISTGLAFGSAVWALSYAGWVPALGIMPSPSRDRPGRPLSMVAAHWLYGVTLSFLYAELSEGCALSGGSAGKGSGRSIVPPLFSLPLLTVSSGPQHQAES